MKLFKIKTCGETDHVAAEDILTCIQFYVKECESNLEDIESIDEVTEDLDKLIVCYDEYDKKGNQIKIPAIELMETIRMPEIVCSTSY